MSGSIKLASSTGSVGQVIGVDAAGNAKWETGASIDPFPFTGSAQITGSLAVTGSTNISLNSPGNNATLTIEDQGNSSFSVGTKILMTGSNVGIIETSGNMKFVAGDSTIISAGDQYLFDKNNFQSGDFKVIDDGSRSALYQHDNLTETGSISFSNTSLDSGIAIRMDDNRMALEMRSGSVNAPIIERKVGTKEINLYDSTASTGSSAQVLTSNAQGGIEWAAGGGGGAAFPFTGSAKITGSLEVVGPTTFKGGVIQTDIGFSTYFGLNSGTANLVAPISNKFSSAFGVGTLASSTGTENAAFGGDTLLNNIGGSKNSAFGQAGLKANLNGGNNSSLGFNTLSNIVAGDKNTAVGSEAGRVIVGGAANTNSVSSTFLGSETKPLNVGDDNTIVIGYLAEGQGAHTVVLGNTSITSTQLRGNVNTTGSLKVRGPGDVGGANGSNTIAAGGGIVVGSNNTVNSTDASILAGSGHTVTGDTSVILGGEGNTINSGFSAIVGAASSGITNGDTAIILGGYQNNLQGTRTYLLGGNLNNISNSGAEFSGIIGGQSNTISTAVTASAIIGGKSITATKNETVYVPELEVATVGGGITMYSPNGTEYKLTVSDAGALVIT